jgi:predicted Zn-dependent protease
MLARELGVDELVKGVTPDGKLAYLKAREAAGDISIMVGDGINDAPVLAGAHASFAMAGGTYKKSIAILDPYAREHDENSLAWSLLSDAYRKAGRMTDLHMARAETLSLRGDYQAAIDELIVARGTTSDKLTLARIEARITQLERAKKDLDSLKG